MERDLDSLLLVGDARAALVAHVHLCARGARGKFGDLLHALLDAGAQWFVDLCVPSNDGDVHGGAPSTLAWKPRGLRARAWVIVTLVAPPASPPRHRRVGTISRPDPTLTPSR